MDVPSETEIGVKALREHLAETLNDAIVRREIVYITSRGRRVAAIVPVTVAERIERDQA